MDYETAKIADLLKDPANVRRHSAKNLDAIKASLARFGQQKPIVVAHDGVVVAGNGTLEAASQLGWAEIHIVRTQLDGGERTAFAIADNRTGELAEWDDQALVEQLSGLASVEGLLEAAGFDEGELESMVDALLPKERPTEDAEVDDAAAVTNPGDLWVMGDHRIICGDSTDPEVVERLMAGETADVVFTDPPYGIDYSDMQGRFAKIENDADDPTNLIADVLALFPAPSVYLCCNWRCLDAMVGAMRANDIEPKSTIVWDKGSRIQNLDRYAKRHEMIVYAGPYGGHPTLDDDVWQIKRQTRTDHPTSKPVELCGRAIGHSSNRGGLVVDPFLGSGSTLIAADQLERRCYGVELSPTYCDVVVARWEAQTGRKATRG